MLSQGRAETRSSIGAAANGPGRFVRCCFRTGIADLLQRRACSCAWTWHPAGSTATRFPKCARSDASPGPEQMARPSIDLPQPPRCQFHEVTVRIAEIDAVPAARPRGAALDSDLVRLEACLPSCELLIPNPECHVQR